MRTQWVAALLLPPLRRRHGRQLPHARQGRTPSSLPHPTGLAILDLTGHRHAPRLGLAIEADVLRTHDAYAAGEIRTRTGLPPFTTAATRTLTGLVEAAGLDAAAMPTPIREHLTATMSRDETALCE